MLSSPVVVLAEAPAKLEKAQANKCVLLVYRPLHLGVLCVNV